MLSVNLYTSPSPRHTLWAEFSWSGDRQIYSFSPKVVSLVDLEWSMSVNLSRDEFYRGRRREPGNWWRPFDGRSRAFRQFLLRFSDLRPNLPSQMLSFQPNLRLVNSYSRATPFASAGPLNRAFDSLNWSRYLRFSTEVANNASAQFATFRS